MKVTLFRSSELTGRTARGTLPDIWGRLFAVEDAGADVFILYGAPQDSYVLSQRTKGNSSCANNTKMDKNPSHPTNCVNTKNDLKDVGNNIDMGSIRLLTVWFDYNRRIRRRGVSFCLVRNSERPDFTLMLVSYERGGTSISPIVTRDNFFSLISYHTLRRTYVPVLTLPLRHNRPEKSADHGSRRIFKIARPVVVPYPSQVYRRLPHTMGGNPCAWFGR